MRIGILGGSFDPVHLGHLILAQYAKNQLNLDKIIFIPCCKSAYDNKHIQTSIEDRLVMLNFAVPSDDIISLFEVNKKGVSYTIDTVKYYRKLYPNDYICFIAGEDTIKKIRYWKDYNKLKSLVDVKFSGKDFCVPQINLSSTLIRTLCYCKHPINYLVPIGVEKYILKNNLYKEGV